MRVPRVFVDWEVLIVDDERDSLEVAARLLQLAGAKITTASNGSEALDKVRTAPIPFRFILSDLSMPDMDGWELLYHIRQETPTDEPLPVIALTAHAMVGDKHLAMTAGFHNYITKPLDPIKFIPQLIGFLKEIPAYAALLTTASTP